jgi:hypothetical protein
MDDLLGLTIEMGGRAGRMQEAERKAWRPCAMRKRSVSSFGN